MIDIKDKILPHIETIIKNNQLEWEIIFGRYNSNENSFFSQIDALLFKKIYNKLKNSEYIIKNTDQEMLDIRFNNKSSLNDIRVSFNNRNDIISFCKNKKIVLSKAELLLKKKNDKDPSIHIDEYGLVSNQKIEKIIKKNDPDSEREFNLIHTELGQDLEKLISIDKSFRYNNRLSFYINNGFRYDLTIVKTPPINKLYSSFRESNVLKGNINHELEMEYLGYTNGFILKYKIPNCNIKENILDNIKYEFIKLIDITKDYHLELNLIDDILTLNYILSFYNKQEFDELDIDNISVSILEKIKKSIINFKDSKLFIKNEQCFKKEDNLTLIFHYKSNSKYQFPHFIQEQFCKIIKDIEGIDNINIKIEDNKDSGGVDIITEFNSLKDIDTYFTKEYIDKIESALEYINLKDIEKLSNNTFSEEDIKDKIYSNCQKNINYILSLQQNTPIYIPIISNNKTIEIINNYIELNVEINKNKIQMFREVLEYYYNSGNKDTLLIKYYENLNKILKISDDDDYEKNKKNIPYLLFNNDDQSTNSKLYENFTSELDKKSRKLLNLSQKYFLNPKPITLEVNHLQDINQPNIINNYTVTDKADGISNLLYIDNDGDIYLIDPNLRVLDTGLKCIEERNTIINGELITNTYDGSNFNKETFEYYAFDIYIRRGEDTSYCIFCHNEFNNIILENYKSAVIKFKKELKDKLKLKELKLEELKLEELKPEELELIHKINESEFKILGYSIKTRLNELNSSISNIDINFIKVKKFYYDDDIFKLSNKCWNSRIIKNENTINKNTYKYDGLIYTPKYLPICYNFKESFHNLFQNNTWKYNYKWKPEDENSIDFLVEIQQNTNTKSDKISKKNIMTMTNGIYSQAIKYKTLSLYNGKSSIIPKQNSCLNLYKSNAKVSIYNKTLFNPSLPNIDNCHLANIIIDEKNNNIVTNNKEVIETNNIVEFYYDLLEPDSLFRWKPIRIRNDKTIAYKKSIENKKIIYNLIKQLVKNHRSPNTNFVDKEPWTLLNLRGRVNKDNLTHESILKLIELYHKNKNLYDFQIICKEFHKLIPNYQYIPIKTEFGNNYLTANNIWKSIFSPITEEMITTGNNIDNVVQESSNVYYNPSYNSRNKSLTIYLQKFHNFIKKNILLSFYKTYLSESQTNISLLDLACGKGGDLFKWKQLNYNTVVGIDISYDNIYNSQNGACFRYCTMLEENKENSENLLTTNFNDNKIPRVYFFTADSGLNIEDQLLNTSNNTENKIYKQLWKSETTNTIDGFKPNFDLNKFNVISLQFALHYFYENKTKLEQLVNNIDKNLAEGGIFIGCCYDGIQILNSLKDTSTINGTVDDNIIWKITKNYSDDFNEMTNTNSDFGKKISVYMHSINIEHIEYLVNFTLLKDLLFKKDIQPLSSDDLSDSILENIYNYQLGTISFEDIYKLDVTDLNNDDLIDKSSISYFNNIKHKMTKDEKKVSFLNNLFIYKKN